VGRALVRFVVLGLAARLKLVDRAPERGSDHHQQPSDGEHGLEVVSASTVLFSHVVRVRRLGARWAAKFEPALLPSAAPMKPAHESVFGGRPRLAAGFASLP
jgi:hypothetical protein